MKGLTEKRIDTDVASGLFRSKVIDLQADRFLVSRLAGSDQERDITTPVNCGGFGRIRHFRQAAPENWPRNFLPIAPACKALGISAFPDVMKAQVFQIAACPWRCWYCFVPYNLLRADPNRSAWLSCAELVDLYRMQEDPPLIIDLSGGSPDIVPEWTVSMMKAIRRAGLVDSTYLWTDDNLSSTYLFDFLAATDLRLLAEYRNYGRVCCFKGFDANSFQFNTHSNIEGFDRQFEVMRRTLALGIDVYGYVTLTSDCEDHVEESIHAFFDRLQELDINLPLRIVPLQIQVFSTVAKRMTPDRTLSLSVQEQAISAWNREVETRFSPEDRSAPICSVPLRTRP